jgi:hypothetical protein
MCRREDYPPYDDGPMDESTAAREDDLVVNPHHPENPIMNRRPYRPPTRLSPLDGETVTLLVDSYALPRGGTQRKVAAGTTGYVERVAAGRARVIVNDAPDGRTDVLVVFLAKIELVAVDVEEGRGTGPDRYPR